MSCRSRRAALKIVLPVLIATFFGAGYLVGLARAERQESGRFFEMRTYIAAEGKLDALNARFRNHTNKLFQKHGIQLIGYWTPAEGDEAANTLIYILAYPDRASRDKSWQSFASDPEWKKAKEESEKDGKLVAKVETKFLVPTDYSPIR